ncbi:MAG: hypothetical protein VX589_07015 [Myxococcota bacterium]|nr:hypothetical protein [Myxococcota bacterium]
MALTTRLALAPASMTLSRLTNLAGLGLTERAIHDVINIASLFALMNRFADGNGVTIDAKRQPFATKLLGAQALTSHLEWGQGRIVD